MGTLKPHRLLKLPSRLSLNAKKVRPMLSFYSSLGGSGLKFLREGFPSERTIMKVSVIIPVYNQSEKLVRNLREKIVPYFDSTGVTYEVIVEDDHSSEPELDVLKKGMEGMPAQVRLDLATPEDGKGKGAAVRRGIMNASGDYALFFDADLATDLAIFDLIKKDLGKYDAYIASRDCPGAVYVQKQPFKRRLTHWGAKMVVRCKFRMKEVIDSQCGYKMFRLPLGKEMAERQLINGFAFDVEYLYFLHLNGKSIKEYPARWEDDPSSSLKKLIKTTTRFYKDLCVIKRNKKHYLLKGEERAD